MSDRLTESAAARIARRVHANWKSTDVERALAATHAGITLRRQRMALGAAGLAISVAAAVIALFVHRPSENTPGAPPEAARASASAIDPVTHFADGSTARVLQGGQIVVQTATETR